MYCSCDSVYIDLVGGLALLSVVVLSKQLSRQQFCFCFLASFFIVLANILAKQDLTSEDIAIPALERKTVIGGFGSPDKTSVCPV